METMTVIALLFAFGASYLGAAWIDAKYNWQLVDWCNGKVANPFKPAGARKTEASHAEKAHEDPRDAQIDELKSRIQTLEKVVTEPAYELNKKINAL